MRHLITICLLLMFSAVVPAQSIPQEVVPIPAPLVTIDEVETLLNQNTVATLEDLLNILPKELQSRYTFMHTSRSRQGSSYEYPRAILFGKDAQFILSYNGHPSQVNYNSIEVMQFDSKTNRFILATVELPTTSVTKATMNRDATRCLGCHGNNTKDLHPIWDAYPHWRGAYGGSDDSVLPYRGSIIDDHVPYENFLYQVRSKNPLYSRYSMLDFKTDTPHPPYYKTNGPYISQRPNFALNLFLLNMNARKVADQFVHSPAWQDPTIRKNVFDVLCLAKLDSIPADVLQDYRERVYGHFAMYAKFFFNKDAPPIVLDASNDSKDMLVPLSAYLLGLDYQNISNGRGQEYITAWSGIIQSAAFVLANIMRYYPNYNTADSYNILAKNPADGEDARPFGYVLSHRFSGGTTDEATFCNKYYDMTLQ